MSFCFRTGSSFFLFVRRVVGEERIRFRDRNSSVEKDNSWFPFVRCRDEDELIPHRRPSIMSQSLMGSNLFHTDPHQAEEPSPELARAELLTHVQEFCLDLLRPSIAKMNAMHADFLGVRSLTNKLEADLASLAGLSGKVER